MTSLRSWFKDLLATERRNAKRKDSGSLVAYYWDGSNPIAHTVQNVSSEGFFMVTDHRWYPGTILTITLQRKDAPEDATDRTIEVLARAIRADSNGVGFSFVLSHVEESAGEPEVPARLADGRRVDRFIRGLKADEATVSIEFALLIGAIPVLVVGILELHRLKLDLWSTVALAAATFAAWRCSISPNLVIQTTDMRRKSVYAFRKSSGLRINSAQTAYSPSEILGKSVAVPSPMAQSGSGRTR